VSPSAVSNLNKKIYAKIAAWRNRRIEGEHPYLYLDGMYASEEGRLVGLLLRGKALWVWIGIRTVGKFRG
jgi:transposase-like protein